MTFLTVAVTALALPFLGAPIPASQEDFAYVEAMPAEPDHILEGESRLAAASGVAIRRRDFVVETEVWSVLTVVLAVACEGVRTRQEHLQEFLQTKQYLPKDPRSFAAATRHDVFQEVFVKDGDQRIRLYKNISRREINALMNRFVPRCVGI